MKTEEIRSKLLCDLTPDLADAIMAEIENRDTQLTPIEALVTILMHQEPKGIKTGDWEKIRIEIQHEPKCEGNGRTLTIDGRNFGFYFNADGQFAGIFGGQD